MPANPPGRRPGPGEPYDREHGEGTRGSGDGRYRDRRPRYGPWPGPEEPYYGGEVTPGRSDAGAGGPSGKSPPTRAERYDLRNDYLVGGEQSRGGGDGRYPARESWPVRSEPPSYHRERPRPRTGGSRSGGRTAPTRAERYGLREDYPVGGERRRGGGDERYRGRGPEPVRDEARYYREGQGWEVSGLSPGAAELDAGLYERQMSGITALISLANDVAAATRSWETIAPPADQERKQGIRSIISRLRQDEMTWNSLFLVLSTGLQSGTGFIFWIITTHLFSVSDVGKGSALISGVSLIGNLSLLGLNIGMGRYLPSARNRDALISSGLAMVAIVGALGALIYILLTPYVASGLAFMEKRPVLIVSFALISSAAAVNTLTDNVFIASRKAKYTTFVDGIIAGFGKLILATLLTGLGAYGLFLASAIGTVLAAVASLFLIVVAMGVRVDLRRPFQTLKPLIRFSAANYIGNVVNLFTALVVPIIVLDRLGAESSAYFFVVLQMAQIVYTAGLALEQTFLAEGSRADADMRQLRRRSLRLLLFFFVLAAGFMIGTGRWLLLAFGQLYYQHGYISLIALTLAAGPISASYWFQTILRLAGKLRAIVVVNVIGAIATCSAVWLGSSHGLTAVAWAWFGGCAVTAITEGIAAREKN